MKPPAATSRRLSPRVTTPALMVWQLMRHLVAESRYPGKTNTNKTDVVADRTPRYQRWAGGMFRFFLASSYFVVLLYSCDIAHGVILDHCLPVQQ